jgi:hypothetical protein
VPQAWLERTGQLSSRAAQTGAEVRAEGTSDGVKRIEMQEGIRRVQVSVVDELISTSGGGQREHLEAVLRCC